MSVQPLESLASGLPLSARFPLSLESLEPRSLEKLQPMESLVLARFPVSPEPRSVFFFLKNVYRST